MIKQDELADYLHQYLACGIYNDYAPNGLQIDGKKNIQRLCTAVTASRDAIEQAIHLKADALLVHHGYFWRGEDPTITGIKHQRIARLLAQDISLFAYHLPLDCHPEIGNNACLGQLLNVQPTSIKMHLAGKTQNLLWSGAYTAPIEASECSKLIQHCLGREPLHIAGCNKPIQRIAWCSGAAQDFIVDAHQLGVDAYLSGEISERTYYLANELGIHYFACGHHASERYGVQALGKHLAETFALEHQFIDSANPI